MPQHVIKLSVLLCLCASAALAQVAPAVPSEILPPRRTGGAPELPPAEIKAPPQPSVSAPAPPLIQAPPPLSSAPRFVLRGVKIEGNSALDEPSIDAATAPFIGKPVS